MPLISANEAVGRTVRVKKGSIAAYDVPNGNAIFTFKKDDTLGVVYSYIEGNGSVFWMFENSAIDGYDRFYVPHNSSNLQIVGGIDQPEENGGFFSSLSNPFAAGGGGVLDGTLNKVIAVLILLIVLYSLPTIYSFIKRR